MFRLVIVPEEDLDKLIREWVELHVALSAVVAVADRAPFVAVGHVVEHIAPKARERVKDL